MDIRKFAMKYAALSAFCFILLRLTSSQSVIFSTLLLMCVVVYAIMQYRDNVNDGFISYGTSLKLGALILFFFSLIVETYSFILSFYSNGWDDLIFLLFQGLIRTAFPFLFLIFLILPIMGVWRVYEKANQIGWACLIPIYNFYILTKIVGKPDWWWLLIFIPFLNLIISVIVLNELSKSFGKSTEYTLGLLFLGFIFYPLLGLSHDEYIGPGGRKQDVASNQII